MKLKSIIIAFFLLIIIFLTLAKNTNYNSEKIEFVHNGDTLRGIINIPKNIENKPIPLVIFVHGDGAVPADNYGYEYFWDVLAKNRIASISWSKKGVDKSTGNWLKQSMTDSANEIITAVSFIKKNNHNQFSNIGLLGFSQGCWVVPKVCARSQNIDFAILVSGAINWKRQSNYFVKKRLEREGKSLEDIKKAIESNQAEFEIFNRENNYADYLAYIKHQKTTNLQLITAERFPFIQKNINSDVTNDLTKITCPVLGVFGDADTNVNVQESYATYDSIFSKVIPNRYQLKIYPNATHDLLKVNTFGKKQSNITTLIKLKWYGKEAFTSNFFKDIVAFILKQKN